MYLSTFDPTAAAGFASGRRTDGDMESDGDGSSGSLGVLEGEAEFEASLARERALLALVEKTGYDIMQENGQRKYGGPPPGGCQQVRDRAHWVRPYTSVLV